MRPSVRLRLYNKMLKFHSNRHYSIMRRLCASKGIERSEDAFLHAADNNSMNATPSGVRIFRPKTVPAELDNIKPQFPSM